MTEETKTEAKTTTTPAKPSTTFREVYPLLEPYSYAAITKDPDTQLLQYVVIEPTLLEHDKAQLKHLRELLIEELDVDLKAIETREGAEKFLKDKVNEIVKKYRIKIEKESLEKLSYFITRDFLHLGKIDPFMRDHLIEDISCDGVGVPIYIWHREYESIPTNIVFNDTEELDSVIIRLANKSGRHISIAQPVLDAGLPDGSRVQLTFGREITRKGSTFTIRKFRADPLTIPDLITFHTMTPEMAAYFWYAIENRHSVMVAGGIASGKTTLLNCLSMFIRPEMKIVSIEDTPELNIPHENWIQSVSRIGFGPTAGEGGAGEVSLFDLLRAAMRQRPDYIIVGEVRGAEAYTLFQAMATGHLGMCTIHAESVPAIIHRLESEPMNVARTLLTAMDMITIQARTRVGDLPARRTIQTSEMLGLDPHSKEILTNDVFRWDAKTDKFNFSGKSYLIEKIARSLGIEFSEAQNELMRRKTVLEWMAKQGIRRYKEVAGVIREYYATPDKVFERARMGVM